jgi:hypothetical protein
VIGIVFAVVTVGAVGFTLWSGNGPPAPRDSGVCWRMTMEGASPRFHRIAGDILNLETCAARLERQYLIDGREIDGAYQGQYIFIDSLAVRSAARLDGSRWRVFFDPQRAALDRKLREGAKTLDVVTGPAS